MKPQDKMLLSLFEQYNKQSITFDTIHQVLQPLESPMIRFADSTYLWTLKEMYNVVYNPASKENKQFLQEQINEAINQQQIELV